MRKQRSTPPAHPYIHDAITKHKEHIPQLPGCRALPSASSVTAKTCGLVHNLSLTRNKASGELVQSPRGREVTSVHHEHVLRPPWGLGCRAEKESQARLGPCPQGGGIWLGGEVGLGLRGRENKKHTNCANSPSGGGTED